MGLNAHVKKRGAPVEIPPRMPPALFVAGCTSPSCTTYGSLFSLPRLRAASKPRPNSMPLTAGMLKMACAMVLSSPSKSGEPMPAGMPVATHSTRPPTLSPASRASCMVERIFSPAKSLRTGSPCLVWRWEICFDKSSREAGEASKTASVSSFIPATSLRCAAI